MKPYNVKSLAPLPPNPVISVIIPIYNEETLLPVVLQKLRELPLQLQIVLVDDGSTDGTVEILRGEEAKGDCLICRHKTNRGKGSAIVTGMKVATGDIIIIQDADMEYDPNDIVKVVQPIIKGETNVCYGSRFLGRIENMKLPNRIANYLLAAIISAMFGQRITDEATAYKAFRKEIIKQIHLNCKGFEFCPEVTAKVLLTRERILEVPVFYTARTFKEGKKIGYKDFFIAIITMIKCKFEHHGQ